MAPVKSTSLARVLAAVAALCAGMLALCCVPPVNAQDDSVPAQRTATVVTHNSVTLIWDDLIDESITHYRISRRDLAIHAPGEFVVIDDNTGSAATSYTDDTVEPGGSYLYRITALNRQGASEWSRYIRADIPAASTRIAPPPRDDSVPAQRTATVVTHNSVTLIWDDLIDESITHYRISRRDLAIHVPPGFVVIDDNTGSAATSYTDDTVEPGGSYLYRITALNRQGASEWSRYIRADIPAASTRNAPPPRDGSVPDRPTGLSTIATFNSIALIWDNPGNSTITGYVILRRNIVEQDPDVFTKVEANTGTATTSYTDTGVEAKTRYAYWIKAINEHGTSPRSDYVNVETPAAPEVTLVPPLVTDLDRANVSKRNTDLPNDNNTLVEDTGSADTGYTDKSAEKGVEYEYLVSARNEAGTGEASEWVRAGPEEEPVLGDGLPGTPRNLTATTGNKEVTLSWEPPADNGNAPATRYRIEWRIDGKDYDKNYRRTARSTTYTTTDQANLANGVKYFFRVKAGNGSGNSYGPYGPASEEVSATPTSGSAVDLGTPVLSETEDLHHGMVQLDWQDIDDAGWYVVQYYHVEDGEWLDLPAEGVDIAFHGSSAVVSNLHGLSWLRVRAMSCAGESEWSQIEQLFGTNASDWDRVPVPEVEEGDEIEPCPVVLGTPVLSKPENLHHRMVRLDWQDIEDAGWYVVQYYHLEGGSGEWVDLPAVGVDIAFHGSSAVVSNLDYGIHWLRVGAASCAGSSEWSQIEQLFGTRASDWEGVPVPEVEEGDEIEPCSEDADTSDNSPATGAPTISGTARVGEVLEVDTSGISDADGLSSIQYEYQWLADDSDIAGASGSTYTLTDNEESKAIKVEVSFTDDEGNNETLTSAATDAVAAASTPNSPATGAPTITGTAQVGETLTANTSGVADADGLSNVQYEYQWLADGTDISGATNATYTLAAEDEGKVITVRVSFTDDADHEETLTSATTAAVAAKPNSPATGAPTIDGTVQVGETLTANTSGITDQDGLSNASYTYRWVRNDGAEDADITGATSNTYTLVDADQGKTVKVRVSFTDDADNEESLASEPTGEVSEDYLLPDLISDPPTRSGLVSVEVAPDGTELLALRFEGYVTNLGVGPLDLSGNPQLSDPANLTSHDVWQRALTTSGDWVQLTKPPVRYETADTHNHFHLMGVMAYSLWDETGTLQIRPSEKIGFCLVDTEHLPERHAQPSVQRYEQSELETCMSYKPDAQYLRMGVSAGWRDTYHRDMVFQWVDVSDVTPGVYRIGVQADPNDVVVESDETNNGVALSEMVSSVPGYVAESQVVKASREGETVDIELTFRRYGSPDRRAHRIITAASNGTLTTEDNFRVTDSSGMEHSAFYSQTVRYTPQADFVGVDTFTFIAFDSTRPDYPISPTVATVTIDMSGLDATVSISDAPASIATGGSVDLDADVTGARPDVTWSVDGVVGGNALVGIVDTEGVYTAPGTVPPQGSVTIRASSIEAPSAFFEAVIVITAENTPATGAPSISGTAQVEETLTVDTSGIADDDGLDNVSYSYQWIRNDGTDDSDIYGATSSTYMPVDADQGKTIKVEVSFTDDADNDETLTSAATAEVAAPAANSPATGELTITGTVQVGETLTANTSGVADADGLSSVQYEYQWLADDSEITGATGSTYTPVAADEGKVIKVRVRFADDDGNDESLSSAATDSVSAASTPNSPATGVPTISGTAQVGQTLTADTSGISDADGLANATFTYQWLADDAEIAGATGLTYTLVAADEGKVIKVRVHFADDAGNENTLTSAATEASLGSEDVVAWSAIMTVEMVYQGYGYSSYTRKAGSLFPASFNVDGTTYTVNMIETSGWMYIGVERELPFDFVLELDGVWFDSNDASLASYTYSNIYKWARTDLSWRDGETVAVRLLHVLEDETAVNSAATGAPTIGGTAQVGKTLTANTAGIADADGLNSVQYEYQWLADDSEITDAIGSTYTPVVADEGKVIKVRVRFADDDGNDESLSSAATDSVSAASTPNSPATGVPTISGTAQVGQTLTADTSGISNADGLANATFTYQWLADDAEIAGATGLTYTLVAADEGKVIKVRVHFADDAGNEDTLTSAATEASLGSEDVVAWSAIMTVEMVYQGYGYSSYARKAGSLFPASFNVDGTTYTVNMIETSGWMYIGVERELPFDFVLELDGVWFDSNDASLASYTYSNIYKWARTDLSWRDGETVAVRLLHVLEDETAVNSAATGAPTIGGTAQVGKTLTANTAGIADADGLSSVQYEYQWLADDAEIAGAIGLTYTLTDSEESKAITVQVSFTDDAENEETLTSGATAAVAGAQPTEPPAKPRNLSATASHDSVTLTWDDPGDDTITGYVILRRVRVNDTGGDFSVLVADTGSAATTYTDDTVDASTTYTYRIKAINEHGTSERSRWFHIDTPAAPEPEEEQAPEPPDEPRGLEATASHDSVTLTWNDPNDDSITGYVILRRIPGVDPEGQFSELVSNTGTDATTYTDDTVSAETRYTYRIKAINGAGVSERSRWVHIDTPAAPQTTFVEGDDPDGEDDPVGAPG